LSVLSHIANGKMEKEVSLEYNNGGNNVRIGTNGFLVNGLIWILRVISGGNLILVIIHTPPDGQNLVDREVAVLLPKMEEQLLKL